MYQTNLLDEIIVDHFAGGGGTSTGIELATGRPVTIAINHDPDAIAMHMKNHPYTEHYCTSVWDINPKEVCKGHPVGLMWLSPDCKHFSKAKGGKPVDKNIRGLAWIAVRWAATVKPRVIIMENVEEIMTWGPLTKDGFPDAKQKGRTFNSFVNALRAQGYVVEWKVLKACDYGAPTIRKRFFLIARCDGKPIVFPKPTHGEGKLPYRTAAECIDWSIPCKSIFGRKKPLAENTMRRIARGTDKFVIKNANPFILPIGYGEREGQAPRVNDINAPLSSIVSTCKQNLASPVFAPFDVMVNHSANKDKCGDDLLKPFKTITSKCGDGIVTPVMTAIGQTGFSEDRSYSAAEPVRTIVSKAEQCVIAPSLIQYHSETTAAEVRGQSLDSPIMTVDSSPRYGLQAVSLQKFYGGVIGTEIDKPVPTVTAVDHNALTAAHITKYYNGDEHSTDIENPLHTITTKDRMSLVESHLCILRNNMDCKSHTAPLPTVTTSAGHFAEIRTYLQKIDTAEDLGNWREVRKLLNNYCNYNIADDEILIIEIDGIKYFISDIGMRMLEPKELYTAQGFPADYIIEFDVYDKKYSKAKQVARCGNAVPPPFAEALLRSNLPELCGKKIVTMKQFTELVAI